MRPWAFSGLFSGHLGRHRGTVHDPIDIRRRIDRLVARVDRRDDYGQLLVSGGVVHRTEDVVDVDAWRADIRRQARADKITVRTGVDDGLIWALRIRREAPEQRAATRRYQRLLSRVAPLAVELRHEPSVMLRDGDEVICACDRCSALGYGDTVEDIVGGALFEDHCPNAEPPAITALAMMHVPRSRRPAATDRRHERRHPRPWVLIDPAVADAAAAPRTVGDPVSRKRNANKNAWSRRRQKKGKLPPTSRNESPIPRLPQRVRPPLPVPDQPTELDQVGVLIVEEQLGLTTTDLDGLRAFARELPFEPSMSLLALLAGRVEAALSSPTRQLKLAESFFGRNELTSSYAALVRNDPKAYVFGPQSLYTLMRVLIEEAYDAPIDQALTTEEKVTLMRAVIASNSVTERGTDTGVGPTSEDLLAYELQVGHYYSRPAWMEEMTRARELYMLATEDEELLASPDRVPVAEWISRVGITAEQQWALGFALSSTANAWDSNKHPHVPSSAVDELLARATLAERKEAALGAMAATRAGFQQAFADLAATGKRFVWELRPFSSFPLLRLEDDGLLLLGRPWMLSWLSEGVHYRAMRGAQADDASATNGRTDHVQRYTAYAGQAFEQYCLRLAKAAFVSPVMVLGEQAYGKGAGQKTSDVAVLVGDDLILFEANARRVGAEPLLTGDPLDATPSSPSCWSRRSISWGSPLVHCWMARRICRAST
jgi:hypothetical protein